MRKMPDHHGRAAHLALFSRAAALRAGLPAAGREGIRRAQRSCRSTPRLPGAYRLFERQKYGGIQGGGLPRGRRAVSTVWRNTRVTAWTAHGRYPTNTPGWWGGAHPFALLDYSIVHNGEISSYDANRRYIEMFGYKCTLQTDTEVITYILGLSHAQTGPDAGGDSAA